MPLVQTAGGSFTRALLWSGGDVERVDDADERKTNFMCASKAQHRPCITIRSPIPGETKKRTRQGPFLSDLPLAP